MSEELERLMPQIERLTPQGRAELLDYVLSTLNRVDEPLVIEERGPHGTSQS